MERSTDTYYVPDDMSAKTLQKAFAPKRTAGVNYWSMAQDTASSAIGTMWSTAARALANERAVIRKRRAAGQHRRRRRPTHIGGTFVRVPTDSSLRGLHAVWAGVDSKGGIAYVLENRKTAGHVVAYVFEDAVVSKRVGGNEMYAAALENRGFKSSQQDVNAFNRVHSEHVN